MDPASQQGGRRLPASFMLAAGSKRPRSDQPRAVLAEDSGGGNVQSTVTPNTAPSEARSAAPASAADASDQTSRQPEGGKQMDEAAPKPGGPRKLPGSFAPQGTRAPSGNVAATSSARPAAPVNQEDTQVCNDRVHTTLANLIHCKSC